MFCPNCGKNLPDGAAFCTECGTKVGATPAPSAPIYTPAPAPTNPILDDSIGALKNFFSANPASAVEKAGKSAGMEWVVLLGITAFLNMLYTAIAPCQYGGDFNALGLLEGLLSTGVTFAAVAFGLMLMFKLAFKKDVALPNLFNLTAVAMLPFACQYLLNIIFGFLWSGLVGTMSSVALIAFGILLYIGIQKLGAEGGSALLALLAVLAVVFIVEGAFNELWYEITTPSAPSYSYSDYSDLYSDLEDFAESFY